MNVKNDIFTTGRGDGRLGGESNTFQSYTNKDASQIIATNQSSTIFYDENEDYLNVTGKNPERMFSMSSTSMSSEERFKPKQPDIKQISISNAHVLILYGGDTVYGCPDAKKEFYGTWVEGREGEFNKITFPDFVGKIHKVAALNAGSVILCTNKTTNHKELYSFGTSNSPTLGQGKNSNMEQYGKLDYPA